jgi:hypothetical protein
LRWRPRVRPGAGSFLGLAAADGAERHEPERQERGGGGEGDDGGFFGLLGAGDRVGSGPLVEADRCFEGLDLVLAGLFYRAFDTDERGDTPAAKDSERQEGIDTA